MFTDECHNKTSLIVDVSVVASLFNVPLFGVYKPHEHILYTMCNMYAIM